MTLSTGVVILLLILSVLQTLLLLGVIRRLRLHEEELSRLSEHAGGPSTGIARPGTRPNWPSGAPIRPPGGSAGNNQATLLVGFFSPACPACERELPAFVRWVSQSDDRPRAVAVLVGSDPTAHKTARRAGEIITEEPGGVWHRAFDVSSYPALALVSRDGIILASGHRVADLHVATSQ